MTVLEHVERICGFRGWPIQKDHTGNATVDISLEGRPSRKVFLHRRMDPGGMVSVLIYTDVCNVNEIDDPVNVLREAGFMNHASFGIIEERLVVMDTQLDETADIEEVAGILTHVVSYAERYKNRLQARKGA